MTTKRARPVVREKTIENSILSFLKMHDIFVFKVESQGTYDAKIGSHRMKRSMHKILGVADIVGLLGNGTFLAIEVKSETGRLSDHQKRFLREIHDRGGIAIVARSIDDVSKALGLGT